MRFNKLSSTEQRKIEFEHEKEWHTKFAWLPMRINSKTVVWFEKYMRKSNARYAGSTPDFEYKECADHIIDTLKGND